MYELLEISDDEDSFDLENDDMSPPNMYSSPGVVDVASSSGTNLRASFIEMGFAPSLVNKAIEENGEGNHESLLETLFAYSASHGSLFGEDTNKNAHFNDNIPLKEEHDVGSEESNEKMATLLKMTFTSDEIRFAMSRLDAPIAKKYEKDTNNPLLRNEEIEKDRNNDALFGIMEKTLQLNEMGFSENRISAAFEKCGSKASVIELADFIVAVGTGPNADKYLSTILIEPSPQKNSRQSLKRRLGDWGSECSSVETSDLPKEIQTDEQNDWKKPKEKFLKESSSIVSRGNHFWMISNPVLAPQRPVQRMTSLEEVIKPAISLPNPSRSLRGVVAKPPYFVYGNVTELSPNSWVRISQFLYSVQPEFVSCQHYSALNRTEGYVHNLPTEDRSHIFPRGPMTIQDAIPHTKKWWPLWDGRKQFSNINCEMTGITHLCDALGRMIAESEGPPCAELQREVLKHCETKNLVWVGKSKLVPLEVEHVERVMGYPLHHSQFAGFSSTERLKALRLSFQTDALGYCLSVLRPLYPDGVTVLSFFDGIGGVEVALHRLGIRLKGVVSVEPSETKRRIVKKWWKNTGQAGELIQLGSIKKLSSNMLEDLFKKFNGFNLMICQNPYSGVESENLDGLDFSLFAEFIRVLQHVRSMYQR